jgi:hypothetical protein
VDHGILVHHTANRGFTPRIRSRVPSIRGFGHRESHELTIEFDPPDIGGVNVISNPLNTFFVLSFRLHEEVSVLDERIHPAPADALDIDISQELLYLFSVITVLDPDGGFSFSIPLKSIIGKHFQEGSNEDTLLHQIVFSVAFFSRIP